MMLRRRISIYRKLILQKIENDQASACLILERLVETIRKFHSPIVLDMENALEQYSDEADETLAYVFFDADLSEFY